MHQKTSSMARQQAKLAGERRKGRRDTRQNLATGLVQAILRDPAGTAAMLEADVDQGGDPAVVLGLLDAVEAIFYLRGIRKHGYLQGLRARISRRAKVKQLSHRNAR